MTDTTPKTVRRLDYTPPAYRVEQVRLHFDLDEDNTTVQARLDLVRDGAGDQPLVLDGVDLELLAIAVDGRPLAEGDYQVGPEQITIPGLPDRCTLETTVRIHPKANTALEGLYVSSGNFCTQCEAEGFRKITYYPDRPDVMARFTTTLVADPLRYPVLLSNGNRVEQGTRDDGRHYATWEDPFPKPSYLFALVAGQLDCLEDSYTTASGRKVDLRLYVEPGNVDQSHHAMESLKKAMAWDEERFGLEYDLDCYMIVAVGDFNMGAMENKGLNVFNTRYVLARPETATDADYQGIEGVIGHEYFHNWTGNRVTCRDWFQLSLKEGLTVFRDQEFSADMQGAAALKRIDEVRILRAAQFPQDAGPMAHPVRPDAYIEINNFYTVTVYNKGAEVIRMQQELLGREGFRRGMDLYFQRHDGQAVTCDDFVSALADANQADLEQFRFWYSQAGTPELQVQGRHDPDARTYTLTVRQTIPATPGQPEKQPMHIPLRLGLIGRDGQDLPLRLEGDAGAPTTRVLELRRAEEHYVFQDMDQAPVPSLLRGFSAPVKLHYDYNDEDLAFLLAHDSDDFNRWEAGQQLAIRTVLGLVARRHDGDSLEVPPRVLSAFRQVLEDDSLHPAMRARILTLPTQGELSEQMDVVDVEGLHQARTALQQALGAEARDRWLSLYYDLHDGGPHAIDADSMGRRALRNRALDYLARQDDDVLRAMAVEHYGAALNMTDRMAALSVLTDLDIPQRQTTLDAFYQHWKQDPLVVDKWLTLQAVSTLPTTLDTVKDLMDHPAFSLRNPNKVRALIGAFCGANPVRFHAADGAGYRFLADQVLALDRLNPQIAARLLTPMVRWRKYDPDRQGLMRGQLERVLAADKLSPDVYEIVSKSLD